MGFQMPDILNKVEKAIPFRKFADESTKSEMLTYAYPCENYISIVVSNPASKYSLKKFFDSKIKSEIDSIVKESIEVTQKSFPRIYLIFKNCCDKLNILRHPKIAISMRLRGINSLTVGTDENPIILISPLAASKLKNSELSFLIGHELGHVAQGNLICHTIKGALDTFSKWSDALGPIVSDMIVVPLNRWYRCSEFTSDRAGLICCGDLMVALGVFNKVSNGSRDRLTVWDNFMELSSDHPTLKNRIEELKKFRLN